MIPSPPTMRPLKVLRDRAPNTWKQSQVAAEADFQIMPADEAFIDAVLDSGLPEDGASWSEIVSIRSAQHRTQGSCKQSARGIRYIHTLFYKGQPMWKMETTSCYDPFGTWGQSSSCILSNGKLTINLMHKGRRSSGDGWNTKEKRVYSLSTIIEESGRLRSLQMEHL